MKANTRSQEIIIENLERQIEQRRNRIKENFLTWDLSAMRRMEGRLKILLFELKREKNKLEKMENS